MSSARILLSTLFLAFASLANAQTMGPFVQGQTLTADELNAAFANKQDFTGPGITNPILNPPWTTPPNTESNNFGVPKQSGNPTWSGTGSILGTTFTVASTSSGSLTAGMTLVGNQILPGTVLVSGGPTTWSINQSYSISTEAMSAEGVYSCAGSICNSGVTKNKFMTSFGTARSIGSLSLSFDGQTVPGGLDSGDLGCCMVFPGYIHVIADTAGGGLPNVAMSNLANGPNAKNTFLVSANGGGGFGVGYNADAFIGNNGVFPHYGFLLLRDQELPTQFQANVGGAFAAIPAYGRCTSNGTIPANNSTLNIGGTTVTFVTGSPIGNQVQIGANMRVTLANLWTFLNASVDVNISKAAWIDDGLLTFTGQTKLVGSIGNSFVLSTAGGSNFTCPGTFSNGGGNGLNVTGLATFSANPDGSSTPTTFANGVPVNFGTSGFASSGSGTTTGGFTNTNGSIRATGTNSQYEIDRRDNNVQAGALYSTAGNVQIFSNGLGADGFTLDTSGNIIAAKAHVASAAAAAVGAGQISYGGSVVAAGASGCPTGTVGGSTVAGCIVVNIAGTSRVVPFF